MLLTRHSKRERKRERVRERESKKEREKESERKRERERVRKIVREREDDHQDIEAKSVRWIRIHIYTYREGNSTDHFAYRSNLQIKQASRLKASVVLIWRRASLAM